MQVEKSDPFTPDPQSAAQALGAQEVAQPEAHGAPEAPASSPQATDLPAASSSGESGLFDGGRGLRPESTVPPTPPSSGAEAEAVAAARRAAALLLQSLWRSPELKHQIGVMRRPGGQFKNTPVAGAAEAIAVADRQSADGVELYFACGEYANADSRKADNVVGAYAFWGDIDCGLEKEAAGTGYATKDEARKALNLFCPDTGIPAPTYVVDSGGGLQVYWVLTKRVDAETWKAYAQKLKALAKRLGMLADPSRTADIASVLRIPGTLNHKYDPPRPVTLTEAAEQFIERDDMLSAIDAAHARLCGAPAVIAVPSRPSAQGEAAATYGSPNLDKLGSALAVLPPDCDEATWKLHRLAPLARAAREHPEMAPDLRKLAMDWSSGALRGEPSKAWVTPGNTNGLTGEAAFEGQWTRFLNDTHNGNTASLGTIYFHAREAGWDDRSDDFEVIDTESEEDAASSSLAQAQLTIDALLVKVQDGDFAAPLEPENLAALSVLYGADQAAYQRARIKLKKANRQVPLGAIDREMRTRVGDNGAAPTHHGYAKTLIKGLTVTGWKPISHGGELYVVDPATKLWVRKDLGKLAKLVAEKHDALDNCTRRSDYNGIAQHAVTLIADDNFFAEAPVGLACPGGFHRIDDGQVKLEPLTPAHRQRVQLPFTPAQLPTPQFDAFLHETFASKTAGEEHEQICVLQEIAGAVMLGLMPRHQKAVMFYDPFGRSGKGTFERILRGLVPSIFVTAVSPFCWHREYFAVALLGSRLNVVGELPDNEPIPAAMFKSVIGGDLITGRNPTHRPVSFTNEAAHLFMSNHLINSRDQSEAFFARWLLVEFPNSRLRSGLPLDPGLAERIVAAEMPGIAHWALTGAMRLLNSGAFSTSSVHDRLMARWRRCNSSLEEFIHECCSLGPKDDNAFKVGRAELYREYASWCEDSGRKPFAKSRVKELLEHNIGLGITWAKLNGYEIFRGVRMKPSGAPLSQGMDQDEEFCEVP
jgi:putative DNA primase/helicase